MFAEIKEFCIFDLSNKNGGATRIKTGRKIMKQYFAIPSNYRLRFDNAIENRDIPATLAGYYGCKNREEVYHTQGPNAEQHYWDVKFLNNAPSFELKRDAVQFAKDNGLIVAFKSHGFPKHINPETQAEI